MRQTLAHARNCYQRKMRPTAAITLGPNAYPRPVQLRGGFPVLRFLKDDSLVYAVAANCGVFILRRGVERGEHCACAADPIPSGLPHSETMSASSCRSTARRAAVQAIPGVFPIWPTDQSGFSSTRPRIFSSRSESMLPRFSGQEPNVEARERVFHLEPNTVPPPAAFEEANWKSASFWSSDISQPEASVESRRG